MQPTIRTFRTIRYGGGSAWPRWPFRHLGSIRKSAGPEDINRLVAQFLEIRGGKSDKKRSKGASSSRTERQACLEAADGDLESS